MKSQKTFLSVGQVSKCSHIKAVNRSVTVIFGEK